MTEKAAFRADIKARTAALSLVYLADSDRGILKSLLALPEFQAAPRVFLYISFGREVDTRALIDLCRKLKKLVAAPTLVLSGGKDMMTPPKATQAVLAALSNARSELLPEAGHSLLSEAPSDVLKSLWRFANQK